LTLAVEIDPAMFESGCHLAAWAGLTPKERSTGGKQRMGGISRAGNERAPGPFFPYAQARAKEMAGLALPNSIGSAS
jgi:transposase